MVSVYVFDYYWAQAKKIDAKNSRMRLFYLFEQKKIVMVKQWEEG